MERSEGNASISAPPAPAPPSPDDSRVLDYRAPGTTDPDRSRSLLGPRLLQWMTPALIVLGIECWLVLGRDDYGLTIQLKLLIGALVVSLVPPVNRFVYACLDRIRHPSRKALVITAIAITIAASLYFPFTGWRQGRNFMPKWQDELSYLIQFHMLAQGKLWMHAHPLADFFDTFQVLVTPVYASMYFPGAALLYTPMTWLHLPYWWVSTACCGATVALAYLIMTELIDGVAGAIAAIMVIGTSMFRKLSLMIGGHPPILLLGSALLYVWLRWHRSRKLGWAIAMGILAGWAAITRPLDAVVFSIPIVIDVLIWIFREAKPKQWLTGVACMILPALPFLALQAVFDIGVTGHLAKTPFQLYADRDYPGTEFGFHPYNPNLRPVSTLPQKQKFHDEWTVPALKDHTPSHEIHLWFGGDGISSLLTNILPNRMMFVFLPAGLLGLIDRRRLLLWLTLPAFIVLFSFYTFGLPHYSIITMHAVILTVLLGARQFEISWPRARAGIATFTTLFLVILSLTEMSEFNRFIRDELFDPQGLRDVAARLSHIQHKPAVVLFHFPPTGNPHEEPVYNYDVAWPDDAEIVRAHDLGPQRNMEIFRYYAKHQPDRAFYLYDRADDSIHFMGYAPELAQHGEPTTLP